MEKTQEELKQLKEEYEELIAKLKELTEDELKIVTGGAGNPDWKSKEEIPQQPGNYDLGVDINF